MTELFPRLAGPLADRHIRSTLEATDPYVAGPHPLAVPAQTGGTPVREEILKSLRQGMLAVASQAGFPDRAPDTRRFDQDAIPVLRALPLALTEAANRDVWANLTACWLLDVAFWRFPPRGESLGRYNGDPNRDTFRRLWWRAQTLGDGFAFDSLDEDQYVQIMERPQVAADTRLARSCVSAFSQLAATGVGAEALMRDAMKRLLREMAFIDFPSLTSIDLDDEVRRIFQEARGSLSAARTAKIRAGNMMDVDPDEPPAAAPRRAWVDSDTLDWFQGVGGR